MPRRGRRILRTLWLAGGPGLSGHNPLPRPTTGYSGGNAISVNCWNRPGTNCPDRSLLTPTARFHHLLDERSIPGASALDKHCGLVLPDIISCLNEFAGEAGKSVEIPPGTWAQ